MSAPKDWPPAPAKWIALLILGAAAGAGVCYSVLRGSTPWRAEHETRALGADQSTAAAGQAFVANRAAAAPSPTAVKININSASKAELELLSGIGPSLADRIIAERQRGGPFGRVEDLSRVRGIAARTIERLRAHVVCESVPEPVRK